MRLSSSLAASAVLAASIGLAGPAHAEPGGTVAQGDLVPMQATFRACDYTESPYIDPRGMGSASAVFHTSGGQVTADVRLAIGMRDVPYRVRLIQSPRPSSMPCNPGDPGVAGATLNTDSNGTGAVTLSGPLMSGATGAWIFIEGPPPPGRIRGEFYTSDVLADV